MFMQFLFSVVLNYSDIKSYECLLHISNDVRDATNPILLHTVLSPDKTLSPEDVGIWDQCPNIIISSSDPRDTFEKYETFLRLYGDGMEERKYIIHFTQDQHALYDKFFESSALYFVADLLVLKEYQDKCELHTHTYIGTEDHGQPQLLDVFFANHTFLYNAILFPDKLSNVHGRILNIGAAKYVPLSDPVKMRGLETKFLLEYVTKYNYTLRFDKREYRLGLLHPNKTATGFTKLMINDQIDLISYGLYMQPARRSFGAFSYPMSEISLTCIVPKPRAINEWTVVYILNTDTWLVMAFSYIVLVFAFSLILKIRRLPKDKRNTDDSIYFMVFRIFGGQPQQSFMKNKDRLLLGTLLSLMIIIHTYFTSKLASFNTVPFYKDEINTLEDMARSKISWYTKYYDEIKSLETVTTNPLAILYQTFRNTSNDLAIVGMMNAKGPKSFGFAINQSSNSKYYTIFDYFTLENLNYFRIIKDHLIRGQYTAFFVRRNSILLPSINQYWSHTLQHGFAIRWELDTFEGTDLLIQRYLQTSDKGNANAQPMQMRDLAGTFIIWSVGLGISLVTFLLEMLYFRVIKRTSNLKLNKCVHVT